MCAMTRALCDLRSAACATRVVFRIRHVSSSLKRSSASPQGPRVGPRVHVWHRSDRFRQTKRAVPSARERRNALKREPETADT